MINSNTVDKGNDTLSTLCRRSIIREALRRSFSCIAILAFSFIALLTSVSFFDNNEHDGALYWGFHLIFVFATLMVCRNHVISPLRRFKDLFSVASRVDMTHPELNDFAVTLVDFQYKTQQRRGVAVDGLVQSVLDSANSRLSQSSSNRVVTIGSICQNAVLCVVSLGLASSLATASPHYKLAASRLLFPYTDHNAHRAMSLYISNVNSQPITDNVVRIEGGAPVELTITSATGSLPNSIWLEVDHSNSGSRPVRVSIPEPSQDEIDKNQFVAEIAPKVSWNKLRVASKFQISKWYEIQKDSNTHFEWYRWSVIPPEYCNLAASTLPDGVIPTDIPYGSRLVFEGQLDAVASNIVVESEDASVQQTKLETDSRLVRFQLTLSGRQHPEVLVFASTDNEPVPHLVRTFAFSTKLDYPPSVILASGSTSRTVVPDGRIELHPNASDDFGLNQLELVAEVSGDSETCFQQNFGMQSFVDTFSQTFSIDLGQFDLKLGNEIAFQLVATDFAQQKQVSRPQVKFQIVTRDDKLMELRSAVDHVAGRMRLHSVKTRQLLSDVRTFLNSKKSSRAQTERTASFRDAIILRLQASEQLLFGGEKGVLPQLTNVAKEYQRNGLATLPMATAVNTSLQTLLSSQPSHHENTNTNLRSLQELCDMLEASDLVFERVLKPIAESSVYMNLVDELRKIQKAQTELRTSIADLQQQTVNQQPNNKDFQAGVEVAERQQRQLSAKMTLLVSEIGNVYPTQNARDVSFPEIIRKCSNVISQMDLSASFIHSGNLPLARMRMDDSIHDLQKLLDFIDPPSRSNSPHAAEQSRIKLLHAEQRKITNWINETLADGQPMRMTREHLLGIRKHKEQQLFIRNEFERQVQKLKEFLQDTRRIENLTSQQRDINIQFQSVLDSLHQRDLSTKTLGASREAEELLETWAEEFNELTVDNSASPNEPIVKTENPANLDNDITDDQNNTRDGVVTKSAGSGSRSIGNHSGGFRHTTQGIDPESIDRTFWSELPSNERIRLRSTYPVEFLPNYSDDLRRYFEKLSQREQIKQKDNQ